MKKRMGALVLALIVAVGLLAVPAGADQEWLQSVSLCVSTGGAHTAVIDVEGALWTWGANDCGQLGLGTSDGQAHPLPVKIMTGVAAVSCGEKHTVAVKKDGSLWAWGSNEKGQLGTGTAGGVQASPVQIMAGGVAKVSCGGAHTAIIKADGSLWLWGDNEKGQLGTGAAGGVQAAPVKGMESVAAVSCGGAHTAAIRQGGVLWLWGDNAEGQLGTGVAGGVQAAPVQVMESVATVSCGGAHTAATQSGGTLWVWGSNAQGQLGTGTAGGVQAGPVKLMENIAIVSCGGAHTAAAEKGGALWLWGSNDHGQLGVGGTQAQAAPVKVVENAATVSCGAAQTVFVQHGGTQTSTYGKERLLWTWGANAWGQLGYREGNSLAADGTLIQTLPSQVSGTDSEKPGTLVLVNLDLDGGDGVRSLTTPSGHALTPPQNPVKEGFTFGGWYVDKDLTTLWDFDKPAASGLTLYARWVKVSSSDTTTRKSQSTFQVDGVPAALEGYSLRADNGGDVTFVKLRDLAALLEGTGAGFNVDWRNGAIYVATKSDYATKNGSELQSIQGADGAFRWSTAPVLVDGAATALEAIVITDSQGGGHTLFKLRDLGQAIGFNVGWSPERGVFLETDKPYDPNN